MLDRENERSYYVGLKVDEHYFVHIIENRTKEKVMVHEDGIDGFIQCLEFFGFR